jgi:hypothetical protein
MSLGRRWMLAVFALGIFCLGMLATVIASKIRVQWVCGKLARMPEEIVAGVGKLECVGAIEDFVVVRRRGGVGPLKETEDLTVYQRQGQWWVSVSRDERDEHLGALELAAGFTGVYTVLYDNNTRARRQALSCARGSGKHDAWYIDGNADGIFERIEDPELGLYLFTEKGWVPARQVRKDYWAQFAENRWYRVEEVGGTYQPTGQPRAEAPASQPESEQTNE